VKPYTSESVPCRQSPSKPLTQYLSRDIRFALDDAAIEELMGLCGHKQVKFWLE
jgi:hypothetical protein